MEFENYEYFIVNLLWLLCSQQSTQSAVSETSSLLFQCMEFMHDCSIFCCISVEISALMERLGLFERKSVFKFKPWNIHQEIHFRGDRWCQARSRCRTHQSSVLLHNVLRIFETHPVQGWTGSNHWVRLLKREIGVLEYFIRNCLSKLCSQQTSHTAGNESSLHCLVFEFSLHCFRDKRKSP